MIRFVYLLLLYIALTINSLSQSFNVSEIDATGYPVVKANFSAFSNDGKYYNNLVSSDFTVNENGLILDPSLVQLYCTENLPVNVVLVLDRSSSMQDKYDGETLWQWVVEGATEFIENFKFSDSAKIALVNFAGSARLSCNFTNNKNELLDSLKKISDPYGATNFNAPILSPDFGAIALLKTRPSYHTRAIVFLTDGIHDSGQKLEDQAIQKTLIDNNIRFYGITLMIGLNGDLQNWAQKTAGKYSNISSKIGLKNIYRTFAEDLKGTIQCQLVWNSPEICDLSELYRRVTIKFNTVDLTVIRDYVAPTQNMVFVESDFSQYIFGDPPIGQFSEQEITITPRVNGIRISNISIIPNDYFEIVDWGDGTGNKPNFSFFQPVNVPRKLVVRFNPLNEKKLRQATLSIEGSPCPLEIPLYGGYQQIKLDEPKVDLFSRCDTIDIKWSGISANVFVDLLYSTNNGVSWNSIARKVKGNSYRWFPDFTDKDIRVKARISEQFNYDFIKSHGGTGIDAATSVTSSKNGNHHYISGYFNSTINIGGISKTSRGKEDFFVAKFDIEGNPVWVKSGGSVDNNDRANGVAIDGRNNVYLTGFTYQGVKIDNIEPILDYPNFKYFFLTKFNSSGQYFNSFILGASPQYPDFQAEGIKIKTISEFGQQNRIIVVGNYKGAYYNSTIKANLPYRETDTTFTAIFDEYLNIVELYTGIKDNSGFSDSLYIDSKTLTKYEVGNFYGNKTIQGVNLSSKGLSDFWVYKYAKNPISEDLSIPFEIARPEAVFLADEYNFGSVTLGDSVKPNVKAFITNNSKLPFTITKYSIKDIADIDMSDFKILTDIIGLTIQPGKSLDVDLWFKPGYLGIRKATLLLSAECALDITIKLTGDGSCGGKSPEIYDFGSVNLNKQKTDTLICVFKNTSQSSVVINPQIRGANWQDFLIILPDWVKAKQVSGKITVIPDECIDLYLIFEPKSLGVREAEINFFVQSPCKNSITKLVGFGISSDVGVTSYNWHERRVNGTYTGEIEIVNNSNATETVDNIQFESGSGLNGVFSIEQKDFPFNLTPNANVKLKVTFNPTQEIEYTDNILVFISSRQEPLVSNLNGIGILPKLNTSWSCGAPVKVGETAQASVTLSNPSKSSVLKIKSIKIEGNDEFIFRPGTNTNDLEIEKEGTLTLPVLFTPVSGGDNSDNFIIEADDYDGTYSYEWKTTTVPIVCDGLEIEFTNPLEFGSLVICDNAVLPVTIKNKSKDTEILIKFSEMSIINNNSNVFVVPNIDDLLLNGGQTYSFNVTYNPNSKGTFASELIIPNSMGNSYKITLRGSSADITLTTDKKEVRFETAGKFTFKLSAILPTLESGQINKLKISFDADPTVIGVDENSFRTLTPTSWNWGTLNNLGSGKYEISGTGVLEHNKTLDLFSVDFNSYLNDKRNTQIFSTIDYGCDVNEFPMTIVNIDEICFNDYRLIELKSNAKFGISSPNPNPANQSININYGVGFDVHTNIQLVNSFGELVKEIYNGIHKSGEYSLILPTSELSSGIYFIRMSSGPYFDTKQILIVK